MQTPGQYNKTSANSANATTPGTGKLQPRQPGVSGQAPAAARPITPRRLSPINTTAGPNKIDPNSFKGTLSPKATTGKKSVNGGNKSSLSPTRQSGGRGPSPRSRIKTTDSKTSSSSSSSSINRTQRPKPIATQNKWTRNSPAATNPNLKQPVAAASDATNEEMRAQQRRVFRLAAQLPDQLLESTSTIATKTNTGPAPLNLAKKTSAATNNTTSTTTSKKHKVSSSRSSRGSGRSAERGTNGLKPLIVVLDLDETLVHSTFHGSGARMYRQIEKRKSKIRRQCESFSLILDDGDRVTVNKRPHVDAFMKALQSPEFEPHVFTAALASYASPVMDRLEQDQGQQLFKRRMYRDSCTPTGMGTFAKDLDTLYSDLSRVVLVDNNPISLMKQPSNGILVPNFFDDPNDDVLPTVLDFLRSLADAPDVRPVLRALKSDH
jgi:CTD nuclear envelope phosphatase 1